MELVNKDIKMLDPFSPNLTLEQKEAILEECKVNPMYFYDRVLGIKASRMTWEVIRTLQNYPKEKPGDHDGDMWRDGFLCEPGIQIAGKQGMGELYRDTFIGGERPLDWEGIDKALKGTPPTFPPKDVGAANRQWSQNELANKASKAWSLTCKNFEFTPDDGITNDKVIETFSLIIGQYDTGENEVQLASLICGDQRSIWMATPGFAYRKRGVGDWSKLDFTPSIKIPQAFATATLYGPLPPVELRRLAVTAWNIVVERNQGRFNITEAMYEDHFQREIGLTVGSDRVKVEMRAGEPSFFYRRNDQWIPL